jgi:hypothetical protein
MAAAGVMVRPTSSVITYVEVEVTSGEVVEMVAVAFWMLVLTTSTPEIVRVSVALRTVVEVTSGPVIRVLAVSLAVSVVVVYAVTIGKLLSGVLNAILERLPDVLDAALERLIVLVELTVDEAELSVAEAELQVCADPIPALKGCVSTCEKSMKLVEAKKFPS